MFGRSGSAATSDESINLKFEKIPGGRGGYNRWTINGKSWPDTNPLFTVQRGKRYRLILDNNSGDEHPVHLHRHSFEITKVGDKTTSGVIRDTISMPRYSKSEVDFVADDPDDAFAWKEERTVSVNRTLQYDQLLFILEPTGIARSLARTCHRPHRCRLSTAN